MISLTVNNVNTDLTYEPYYTFKEKDGFQIIDITGISSLNANINTAQLSGVDGSYFIQSKISERNIVISIRINSSATRTVEQNRLELYKIFRVKEIANLEFRTEENQVRIDGYVESIECNTFSESEIMQVSIICPSPYFYQSGFPTRVDFIPYNSYMLAQVTTDVNKSDVDIGFYLRVTVEKSFDAMIITNGNEMLTITGTSQGDVVEVNTKQGEKTVKLNGDLYFSGASGDFVQIKPISSIEQIAIYCINGTWSDIEEFVSEGISGYINFKSMRRGI